jgi:hypothetical protein
MYGWDYRFHLRLFRFVPPLFFSKILPWCPIESVLELEPTPVELPDIPAVASPLCKTPSLLVISPFNLGRHAKSPLPAFVSLYS